MSLVVEAARTFALARRVEGLNPAFWDNVGALFAGRPNLIFFGGGVPSKELMPVARLREASAKAWDDAPFALDYGEAAGYRPLRELIATRMAAQGVPIEPDHLLLINGSQQGIDLIAKLTLDPGDVVIVEGPTFLGAIHTFGSYEARIIPVPVDAEGLDVAALEGVIGGLDRAPKLIYTIPTFQNPTGVTMTRVRREALLAVARRHGILVLEDDPYGEFRYDGEPVPALRALDPDVVYLGTFSKTIAPGIRIGWLVAPPELLDLLASARESVDIHNERIMTRTVYHAAVDFLDDHVVRARAVYHRRRDTLLAALRAEMPAGVRWSEPEGGFFVWVDLPDGFSADDLLPLAADAGAAYFPGSWFYPDQAPRSTFRLNFSTLPEEVIVEGMRRLGGAVRNFLD